MYARKFRHNQKKERGILVRLELNWGFLQLKYSYTLEQSGYFTHVDKAYLVFLYDIS